MVHVKFDEKEDENDEAKQNRQPKIEHFMNLNTTLLSLVDFIRPETYIAQDELEQWVSIKQKYLQQPQSQKRKNPKQMKRGELELAEIQSVRTTSAIYRFLARHNTKTKKTTGQRTSKTNTTALSHDELLEKLHSKMTHRNQSKSGDGKSKKRKRSEESIKLRKKTKKQKTSTSSATPKTTNIWEPSSTSDSTQHQGNSQTNIPQLTTLTFGKFDFGDQSVKKNKKNQPKSKKLTDILKKVENEQSSLSQIRDENPVEAHKLDSKVHWENALLKAQGAKVRDNVQMLKKSIKKQTKLKQRSQKKWQERIEQTEKQHSDKQQKRVGNIQKRKDEKKAKQKKRAIKRGRLVK
ncbi:unnamed protein product [Didymodactylos carnosus]|nr:unnamed protein product [Didymodactylos carnosus]CAF4025171.1 unnamed protein product [Didymodactylos carnosus]